jgi:hypothetical protein
MASWGRTHEGKPPRAGGPSQCSARPRGGVRPAVSPNVPRWLYWVAMLPSYLRSLFALFAALFAARSADDEADPDLALFKRQLSRALRVYPTHYSTGARAFRDPKTRTKLVAFLDPKRFDAAALAQVSALMTAQPGHFSQHVEHIDDPASPAPAGTPEVDLPLALVRDVAWL